MIIARVIGDVVSIPKPGTPRIRKAVLVQPLNLDSSNKGTAVVAFNAMGASVGDVVLLLREGFREIMTVSRPASPGGMAVVGIVDKVDLFPVSPSPEHK
jgi:ethanolamine utilization protein EutN